MRVRRLHCVFNLQGSEIIIVLLLALVVLGPEKLPDAMRKAGKAYSELKKMSTGFQTEFRAAVEEPLREIRDTANVLRDSADFTKLQDGDRTEKPKSGEMASIGEDGGPTVDVPTFETPENPGTSGPVVADDSKPAPFAPEQEAPVRPERAQVTAPAPFAGMSSSAPRPEDAVDSAEDPPATPTESPKPGGPFSGVSSAAPRPTGGEPEAALIDGADDGVDAASAPMASSDDPTDDGAADMAVANRDSNEQGDR